MFKNGKQLGSFLFFYDSEKRPCFKFSGKPKIYSGDLWVQDKKTLAKKSFLKTKPEGGMSFDVSYKFDDHLLEIKSQEPGKDPVPLCTEIPTPPQNYLFLVRIKNWHNLSDAAIESGDLILNPPGSGDEVVLFFSFVGPQGKPFLPEDGILKEVQGQTITIDLPCPAPYDRLYIGVGEDAGNNEKEDILIKAPNHRM